MSLEEKIAELCHEQWCRWMQYLFSKCTSEGKPPWRVWIGPASALRWKRQMRTPYDKLSESEKESDRIEARKFIALFLKEAIFSEGYTRCKDGVLIPNHIVEMLEQACSTTD